MLGALPYVNSVRQIEKWLNNECTPLVKKLFWEKRCWCMLKVQPTSVAKRSEKVTKGNKQWSAGPFREKCTNCKMEKRNLEFNINPKPNICLNFLKF